MQQFALSGTYNRLVAQRADDLVLIGLLRKGSTAAYERLFRKYWPVAWRAAHAVTLDRALADDVAQEAMERVLGSLEGFDSARPLAPWVKRIAVNRAIDEVRRDRRLVRGAAPPEQGPLWRDDAPPQELEVAQAVAALEPEKRLVVVLHYWLDHGVREIAELLDLPVGTVTSRLTRARNELRGRLADEKEEEHAA
jgi:RNA polymerase sigma-70 factor, ECF subfamily